MPEMFYVQIKPCPMGFTLQSDKKACYCDPLLNNDQLSITSCNINDRTILRPVNSWTSAVTVYNSHSYTLYHHNVHLTTAYLIHHTSICPILTHSASLKGLV